MNLEQQGPIRRVFVPWKANLIAGIIVAVLFMGWGCVIIFFISKPLFKDGFNIPIWHNKDASWITLIIMSFFGLVWIGCGYVIMQWSLRMFTFRIEVRENGFGVFEEEYEKYYLWEDILKVEEVHIHERLPLLSGLAKYALPTKVHKRFLVHFPDQNPLAIDANLVVGHIELAGIIWDHTVPRGVPWEILQQYG